MGHSGPCSTTLFGSTNYREASERVFMQQMQAQLRAIVYILAYLQVIATQRQAQKSLAVQRPVRHDQLVATHHDTLATATDEGTPSLSGRFRLHTRARTISPAHLWLLNVP